MSPSKLIQKWLKRDGLHKGNVPKVEKFPLVIEKYYKLRGCDPDTEIPTKNELARLGLYDVIDVLESAGFHLESELSVPEPASAPSD